jgi:hypothetical protein
MNALFADLWSFVLQFFKTAVTPKPAGGLTAAQIIVRDNAAYSNPVTGGVTHLLTAAEALAIASELIAVADSLYSTFGSYYFKDLTAALAYVLAHVKNESLFDPNASDPNLQTIPAGQTQTAEQIFMHTDIGLAQIDGSTLMGEANGASWEAMMAKAFTLSGGAAYFEQEALSNLSSARTHCALSPTLLQAVDKRPIILAIEAYNAGFQGALDIAAAHPVSSTAAFNVANWGYAMNILADAEAYATQLTPQKVLIAPRRFRWV